MNAFFASLAGGKSRLDRLALILSCFCVLLPILGLLAPKAVVPLVLVAAVGSALILGRDGLPWQSIDRPILLSLAILTTWCIVTSIWTYHPLEATVLALRLGALFFALVFLCAAARQLGPTQRRLACRGLALGLVVTAILVIVEFSFGFPIFSAIKGEVETAYSAYSRLNRGISTLSILVWPLAAFCWYSGRRLLALIGPPALLALSLYSESSATVLGLAMGLLVAGAASLGRSAVRLILAAAVVGALIGSPGIAKLMKQEALDQADYLPNTARYRVHIWGFVADRIAERPVFGWGFDSSASIPTYDAEPFGPDRKLIPSHPHNGALQIFLELGIAGAAIALGFLFLIGRRIDALSSVGRVCSAAMFVTILAIASTAYGLWQSHWLSVIGSAAIAMILALPSPEQDNAVGDLEKTQQANPAGPRLS